MATKDQLHKELEKELKEPDQFVSFWTKTAQGAAKHRRTLIGAGIGVLVLAIVGLVASSMMEGRTAELSRDFAKIEQIATASLLPEKADAPVPDDGVPHFKTAKERQEAALAEADKFLGAHGSSKLGDEARLVKARLLVGLGRAGDAIGLYEALSGSLDERLRFLARDGLAFAYEESGQLDKALEQFTSLADDAAKSGLMRDRALFNRARLLERKGSAKEAEKVYREILEKTPTTALKDEINNRLALLEGK